MNKTEKTRILKENTKLICKLYIDGMSSYKIASKFGFHHSTILNLLKKQNIKLRTTKETSKKCSLDENIFNELTEDTVIGWMKNNLEAHVQDILTAQLEAQVVETPVKTALPWA